MRRMTSGAASSRPAFIMVASPCSHAAGHLRHLVNKMDTAHNEVSPVGIGGLGTVDLRAIMGGRSDVVDVGFVRTLNWHLTQERVRATMRAALAAGMSAADIAAGSV